MFFRTQSIYLFIFRILRKKILKRSLTLKYSFIFLTLHTYDIYILYLNIPIVGIIQVNTDFFLRFQAPLYTIYITILKTNHILGFFLFVFLYTAFSKYREFHLFKQLIISYIKYYCRSDNMFAIALLFLLQKVYI